MKLYSYFRSSASCRVRIALNLKGLAFETVPMHLLRGGGAQFAREYWALNPNALVPALIDDVVSGATALTQSLAIIEYLDETHPEPALLPDNALDRAYVRSIALAIACDIHPLNNLRVLRYLVRNLNVGEDAKNAWCRHWCEQGKACRHILLRRQADARRLLPDTAHCARAATGLRIVRDADRHADQPCVPRAGRVRQGGTGKSTRR